MTNVRFFNKYGENGGEMTVDVSDQKRIEQLKKELAGMRQLEPTYEWQLETRGTQSMWHHWRD